MKIEGGVVGAGGVGGGMGTKVSRGEEGGGLNIFSGAEIPTKKTTQNSSCIGQCQTPPQGTSP